MTTTHTWTPADLFKPGTGGSVYTPVDGGLRTQVYKDGVLVDDYVTPVPTEQANGRMFIDCALVEHIRSLTERLEKAEKALKRIAMRAETFVIDDTPMKPSSMMVILGIACSALGDAAIAQEGAEHE